MLMVIFGAGASYDSSHYYPASKGELRDERPPLASELFGNRSNFLNVMDRYPQCKPIIPFLDESSTHSIEATLQQLYEEAPHYKGGLRQLLAVRFYLHEVITLTQSSWHSNRLKNISNYAALLDQIYRVHGSREPVILVSFNYDVLLENAMSASGVRFSSMDDYITNQRFKLIKPHGSINWGREIANDFPDIGRKEPTALVREIIELEERLIIGENILMNANYLKRVPTVDRALLPAIAVPVEDKAQFECPPEHLAVLQEWLPKVDHVMIVGWRASEKHFLRILCDHLPEQKKLFAVNGNMGFCDDAKNNMDAAGIKFGECYSCGAGFSEMIMNREAAKFLSESIGS